MTCHWRVILSNKLPLLHLVITSGWYCTTPRYRGHELFCFNYYWTAPTSLILPVHSKKPKNDQNGSFLRNCNFSTKDSWFETSSLTETKLYFESNCFSYQNYVTKIEIFHVLVKMVLFEKIFMFIKGTRVILIRIRFSGHLSKKTSGLWYPWVKSGKLWYDCDILKWKVAISDITAVSLSLIFRYQRRKTRFI